MFGPLENGGGVSEEVSEGIFRGRWPGGWCRGLGELVKGGGWVRIRVWGVVKG